MTQVGCISSMYLQGHLHITLSCCTQSPVLRMLGNNLSVDKFVLRRLEVLFYPLRPWQRTWISPNESIHLWQLYTPSHPHALCASPLPPSVLLVLALLLSNRNVEPGSHVLGYTALCLWWALGRNIPNTPSNITHMGQDYCLFKVTHNKRRFESIVYVHVCPNQWGKIARQTFQQLWSWWRGSARILHLRPSMKLQMQPRAMLLLSTGRALGELCAVDLRFAVRERLLLMTL